VPDGAQSGKAQFNYIYGVGFLGSASLYVLLNLMSETGIDAYRVVSILGYCLLPMVGVGAVSIVLTLESVRLFAPRPRADALQRLGGLRALAHEHRVVHVRSLRHLRRRAAPERPARARRVPRRPPLRLLCAPQRVRSRRHALTHRAFFYRPPLSRPACICRVSAWAIHRILPAAACTNESYVYRM
jgi:hypothetical protein